MDRYPLHRQFIPAHGKLTPVKLGCRPIDLLTGTWELTPVELGGRCIDLSTGKWEFYAGRIRGPVHRFIDRHMGNKCRSNQGAGASIYRPAHGK